MSIIGIEDIMLPREFFGYSERARVAVQVTPSPSWVQLLLAAVISVAPALNVRDTGAIALPGAFAAPGILRVELPDRLGRADARVSHHGDAVVVKLVGGSLFGQGSSVEAAVEDFKLNVVDFLADVGAARDRGMELGGAVAKDWAALRAVRALT